MTASANCAKCGAPVIAGTRFCTSCGADVSGAQGNVATAFVPRSDVVRPTMSDSSLLEALRHATLGEYEVLAELGRGGMASVYLAHDLSLDRKVAIKVMSPSLLAGEGMVERFKREARTSAQLSHPHIIPIYAVRESENLVYFVMKFIEGRSLESIIKELGKLPISMAQSILQQVGAALGYAHRRGVVHRDIKPANIMIDADGWAIVTDFGIAKVTEAKGLTMTGATIGTPSYMSPEQCAAKEITGASDQYSYGIVAYECLAGKQPFTGDSIMAIMYQHFNEPPPPLLAARPDCPPDLAEAVMRMLEKEPDGRFPDMDAAVAALGGTPLAPDDPVRTQLMTLASTGLQSQMLKSVATPRTPLPAGRSRPGKTTKVEPTTGMTLSPARVTVAVGGSVQFTATRRSRSGVSLPGDAITWACTDTTVATVDEFGLVTAVKSGTAIITATFGTVSATGTVTVAPAKTRSRRGVGALVAVLLLGGGGGAAWYFGPWRAGPSPGTQTAAASPSTPADTGGRTPADSPNTGGQTQLLDSTPASLPPASRVSPSGTRPSSSGGRPTAPQTSAPEADTLVPRLQRQAEAVRQRAQQAGATAAELQAGDALVLTASQFAAQGRVGDALDRLSQAMTSFTTAEGAAKARAAQAAAPPQTATNPPPNTQPTAPVDPRPGIDQAIATYARALESRRLDAIRAIYPGLTRRQEEAWRNLFQVASSVRADLRTSAVQLNGDDAAEVAVAGTLEFETREGRQRNPLPFQASLARRGTGWVITEIR